MNAAPDDNIDRLLQDIARVISDNSQFLSKLTDESVDLDDESGCDTDGDGKQPNSIENDEFEEL